MSNRIKAIDVYANIRDLIAAGLSEADAKAIRRSAAKLHHWFELECGTDVGLIQQNEETGKWTMHPMTARGYDTRGFEVDDTEARHRARIAKVMANYPHLAAYIQGDPRGCPVYICNKDDARQDRYTRGIAVIV